MKLVLLISLKDVCWKIVTPRLDGHQKKLHKKSQGQRLCVWPSSVVPIRWPNVWCNYMRIWTKLIGYLSILVAFWKGNETPAISVEIYEIL